MFTLFDITFSFLIVVIKSWNLFSLCFSVMKKIEIAKWKHIDCSVWEQLNAWNEQAPVFERSLLWHELFELFLINTEMGRICIESTNYASLKGNYKVLFFNWDSLHARLNSPYKAWCYKKKKHKKIKAYRKSLQKEPTVNRCLLILGLKPCRV